MMGFKGVEGKTATELFQSSYRDTTAKVYNIYRTLFYGAEDELQKETPKDIYLLFSELDDEEDIPEEIQKVLRIYGFSPTIENLNRIKLLRDPPSSQRISPTSRGIREKLAPFLVAKAAGAPDPNMAIVNTERFLSTVGGRRVLYALLAENPELTTLLIRVFGSSQYLANALIERPENLEILLSSELSRPIKEDFLGELSRLISHAEFYEEKLDIIRHYKNQEFFRIGINDLQERITTEEISDQISRLAEAILETALSLAKEELYNKYGKPASDGFFIIGMGKLGGRELIYGSDLDIFFAYSEGSEKDGKAGTDGAGISSGPKVITDHEYFVRAAFEVDTRLRPSGNAGPLTVSKTALLSYHKDKAQAWERQAALKARVVAGNIEEGKKVIRELQEITTKRGLSPEDGEELLKIRKRMEQEIAKEDSETLNIKTGYGGLVDIEFVAQALFMRYKIANKDASLAPPDTLSMLEALQINKRLDDEQFQILSNSYSFYRLIETRLRIMQDNADCRLYYLETERIKLDPELSKRLDATASLARRTGYSGKTASLKLIKDYKDRSMQVRKVYLEIMKALCSVNG